MALILDALNEKYVKYAAETMIYFEKHKLIEIAKRILVECELERPDDVQQWIGENIERIANKIYEDCLNNGKDGVIASLHLTSHFLYRVVVHGRRGSGRRTQAIYIAKRFNLVFIDAESLIYQHLRGDDDNPNEPADRELQRAFYYDNCRAKGKAVAAVLEKRLLQKDCLTKGWVLINFPNTLEEFKEIFESSRIPPNKLVYLLCSEQTCRLRLCSKPRPEQPYGLSFYDKQEMRYFTQFESEINVYLGQRHETQYVDAEECSHVVRGHVFTKIEKSPYVMGLKKEHESNERSSSI